MGQQAMLRLQAVEDELVKAGFDEFILATDAGTFTSARWRGRALRAERSRRRMPERTLE
jgi:hypothetical protein